MEPRTGGREQNKGRHSQMGWCNKLQWFCSSIWSACHRCYQYVSLQLVRMLITLNNACLPKHLGSKLTQFNYLIHMYFNNTISTCRIHMSATKIINLIFSRKVFIGKFWTRKLWQFPTNSPNLSKFSPTNIFHYMVHKTLQKT